MFYKIAVTAVISFVSAAIADEPPVGRVVTRACVPMVLGHPDAGHVDLYEFDAWMNEAGMSESHVRRTGAPPYENITHDGYTPFDVLPGQYAILLHQPEWFVRPAVVPDIKVKVGMNKARDLTPELDYACLFGQKMGAWQKLGLPEPWDHATVFHQTFVARGTSITHAHYKLAGCKAQSTRVSIHEVNESSPADWKQVGPERIDEHIGALNDNWVGWRSGEIKTTVGQRYAMRIEGRGPSDDNTISMLVHRDALGPGYDKGTAYADGKEQPYDIYSTVSSDIDTVIPYMRIHDIKPGKLAGSGRWSQTWVAQGKSLAAVDLLVAWADDQDGVAAEIRIHEKNPSGKVVGVTKRSHTAWWGPGHGFLGFAWLPGEVELTPGKTYCAEFIPVRPSTYYSVSVVNHPKNLYPHGTAFRDGKPYGDTDLEMTVVEYKKSGTPLPAPVVYQPKGENLLTNGDFEQGKPNRVDSYEPPGWKQWHTAPTAFWYDTFGRNGSNSSRVIGGAINSTAIHGGLVQRVENLDSNKHYRLSGWVAASGMTDKNYLTAIGYDPTGQTNDPDADTIVWKAAGRHSFDWEQIVINNIRPKDSAISVWTRGRNVTVGRLIFTADFDDLVLENEKERP